MASKKKENESFTDVILRITGETGKASSSLLKLIENMQPDEDLAKSVELVMKRTRKAKLRRAHL